MGAAVRKSATREEQKAVEVLLALKCVDAKALPDYVWKRAVAACLRRHQYEFEPIATRRRGRSGTKLDGIAELKERVRDELGIDRLPAGKGESIEYWAKLINPDVEKRKAYAERVSSEAAHAAAQWTGIIRRVEAALRECAYEKALIRGDGITKFGVQEITGDWQRPNLTLLVSCEHMSVSTATGQVRINATVRTEIRRHWYGRVYKRGLAVIEGCFVVDLMGYGVGTDGCELFEVKVARRCVGFQVNVEFHCARRGLDGVVQFCGRGERASWTDLYPLKKTES